MCEFLPNALYAIERITSGFVRRFSGNDEVYVFAVESKVL